MQSSENEKVNILMVDDCPENLLAMEAILSNPSYHLVKAQSGKEALRHLLTGDFALILLDIHMPEMDGFETAVMIRERERSKHTPIIFATGTSNRERVFKGYETGAVDYLFKPLAPEILRAKVAIFADMFRVTQELARSESMLRALNETLEQQVAERTAELQIKSDEVRTMSQQLWQAAKLATMGELAASIAHELNNPLATVSLRVESLLAEVPEDDAKRRTLAVIDQEVERMGNLIQNLLQFSRRSQQQISTIDVRDEITSTLELIHYHLRNHHITTMQECAPGLPLIQADRQQLRQLFLNLFTNASDAMPQGGTLTIRTHESRGEWGNGKVGAHIVIEITDTGVGIAPELLSKVLEPFFTTKEAGKGTGLGLPICRRIVQEHYGTLDMTSEIGKGTTIRITLPTENGANAAFLKGT
jgi:signal transduction histidine kinase